jgi:alkylation response protein AidB-like acyl-CoA dehydrogenase
MEFAFDEQQLEFRAQLRTFLERECTAGDVRAAFGGPTEASGPAPSRRRWKQLAEMGVVGLTAPERDGGLGLGAVDLVGLLEESGRAALPEPLAETTGVAVPLLTDISGAAGAAGAGAAAGERDAPGATARHWLRLIASGDAVATVVQDTETPAVWADGPHGADVFVVVAPEGIVVARADEVDVTPVGSIDPTRRLAKVAVHAGAGAVLCDGGAVSHDHIVRMHRRGAFASAAVLLGAADRLISFSCEHALEREQFGRPIGSFQAVKHHLANAYVALEMARPVVYRAAWSLDDEADSVGRDCSMAKSVASDAALQAARVALQIHGAMGYTWEHDLHMWMKRVWFLAASWGDSATHLAAVLDDVAGARAWAAADGALGTRRHSTSTG